MNPGTAVPFHYRVVDVFTSTVLEGNPLAVFPDAAGLDAVTMQRVAQELNLAETAFVGPSSRPGCAARVRIFTPRREMAFAGHPTLGTSFVLVDEKRVVPAGGRFQLEEQVGAIGVRMDAGERPTFWLTTPPIREGQTYDRALCAELLGLEPRDLLEAAPQLLDAGNPVVIIPLAGKAAVDRACLNPAALARLKGGDRDAPCIFLFAPVAEGAYSRMFAPEHGVPEDPATGSATGPLARYMMKHGMTSARDGARFVSEQGVKMGRRSLLQVHIRGDEGRDGIEVGGQVAPLAEATLYLPRAGGAQQGQAGAA